MNEKKYKKRFDLQNILILKQSEQIKRLNSKIESLELKLKEKDEIINSVEPLRKEMTENIQEQKRLKKEYKQLIQELKQMKKILNQTAYKGRWWIVKFLIK